MVDLDVQACLKCFDPPLPQDQVESAIFELQEILAEYQSWGNKRVVMDPFRQVDESDEAYDTRCLLKAQEPRKPGRPRFVAQELLVIRLRGLLGQHGSRYGIDERNQTSPLIDLIRLVDLAAGKPRGDVYWEKIAKKCADPLHSLRLLTGLALEVEPQCATEAKKALNQAFHKANKKRSKK